MISAFSLPVVFAALVWLRLKSHAGRRWQRSILEAALVLGAGTLFFTELLGLFHLMRPLGVTLGWTLSGLAGAAYLCREVRQTRLGVGMRS